MNCINCGKENQSENMFCIGCGAKLENVCTNCGAAITPGTQFCPMCGKSFVQKPQKEKRVSEKSGKMKNSKLKTVVAVVLAVLIVGAGVFGAITLFGKDTAFLDEPLWPLGRQPESGNAVEYDGWIYYSVPYSGLYKMRTNGSEKTNLIDEVSIKCDNINVVNDWVYFSKNWEIYRIHINGGTPELVFDTDQDYNRVEISSIIVAGDWIYYSGYDSQGKTSIYRVRTDGTHQATAIEDANSFNIVDGWIYYSIPKDTHFESQCFRVRPDGSAKEEFNESFDVTKIVDGWAHDHSGIRYNLENGVKHTIHSDIGGWYAISDGWIYFRNDSDGFRLYKIKIDGSERTDMSVYVDTLNDISVAGDWVFYKCLIENTWYMIRKDGTGKQPLEPSESIMEPYNSALSNNIDVGAYVIVAIKEDGSVSIAGLYMDDSYKALEDWTDIVSVKAGGHGGECIAGLKSDGTVYELFYGESRTLGWSGIVSISVGNYGVIGVKSDGTVVTDDDTGVYDYMSDWHDIESIYVGAIGLKKDGTIVVAPYIGEEYSSAISGWSNIVAVSAGSMHLVGLKGDGTVVAVGNNDYGQCDVGEWEDIVAIATGPVHTVGLKADGTIIAIGNDEQGINNLSQLSDVIAIVGNTSATVALKIDGTIVVAGYLADEGIDISSMTGLRTEVRVVDPANFNGLLPASEKEADKPIAGSILDTKYYDLPIISLVDWEDEIQFKGVVPVEGGYNVVCDIVTYKEDPFEEDPSLGIREVIGTKQFFIASDAIVHCIMQEWDDWTDMFEQKTFEGFLIEGSDYGGWCPEFFALIEGNRIIEMVEVYTP